MNGDELKNVSVNLRVSEIEKERIIALANYFCGGDTSNLQRQLFLATERAMLKHGSKTRWPPELNFYPPGTKTQQDLDNE